MRHRAGHSDAAGTAYRPAGFGWQRLYAATIVARSAAGQTAAAER